MDVDNDHANDSDFQRKSEIKYYYYSSFFLIKFIYC